MRNWRDLVVPFGIVGAVVLTVLMNLALIGAIIWAIIKLGTWITST